MAHVVVKFVQNFTHKHLFPVRKSHVLAASLIVAVVSVGAVQAYDANQENRLKKAEAGITDSEIEARHTQSETRIEHNGTPVSSAQANDDKDTFEQSPQRSNRQLYVNGEEIPLPQDGYMRKQMTTNGRTEVEYYSQDQSSSSLSDRSNRGSTGNSSSSSVVLEVYTESHSTGSETNEFERGRSQRNVR